MRSTRSTTTMVAVTVLLAASSAPSSRESGGRSVPAEACSLLTQAQVSAALSVQALEKTLALDVLAKA